ncbi:glycoside transferase [Listeria cossartiae subsp. cayugensis]|uniref:Glycoside transferase n=1 Tax=Listeria cossartiae subsp. cayugensis TaxID=2713505 RepID=A0ABU2IPH6_9LIST|nr:MULTISPECIES: glycoside transferase [Listeria]MDT0000238.1 glycoside transferase [Listeria cossartiae subsp. cayugensis]MDT0008674.1 glycoside transferase [Listeria cossartiae subsp. cayugensis]MDT0030506.1 glycoside transferase [Listeria cossartiae subsp. cayugensis]MDT0038384.1 glycoside transferase [Listeria cossartiae subsp. cayugensis]MDT0043735.1 glycoside transferase [Listeria cossartiae subsp. cayugensis]
MKRMILILILLVLLGTGLYFFLRPEPKDTVSAPKETTPTSTTVQQYVKENYTAKNGLIIDYKNAQNPHYLAESIGLYMEYLVEVNDSKTFQEQVTSLQKNFITNDSFIKWEATDSTTTNAIVDDFRITDALYQASDKFEHDAYKKLADKLLTNTKKYSAVQGTPVDFYDFVHKKKADTLHLSYLNIEAMQHINYRDKAYLPIQTVNAEPFFTEVFQNGQFHYADANEVNMIDQMLIAIAYYDENGDIEPNFDNFLQTELASNGKIYARYQRETKKPSSENESTAVYAFLTQYFNKTNQAKNGKITKELLEKMDTSNPETTHFFDYINKEITLKK